jgi:thiol-disulfide isomerase/thioredoxin
MKIEQINKDKFDELTGIEGKYLIKFSMNRCYPCKLQTEILEENQKKLFEKYQIKIYEIFIDNKENRELGVRFNIKALPIMDYFVNGKHNFMEVGRRTIEEIEKFISKLL